MAISLDGIQGLWFVNLFTGDFLLGASKVGDGWDIQYRFLDHSTNSRRWYTVVAPAGAGEAEVLGLCQRIAARLAAVAGTEVVESLRQPGDNDDAVMERLQATGAVTMIDHSGEDDEAATARPGPDSGQSHLH